ncbi:MAG: glycoside hydrolase family 43 protein [Balneolaceae bacterium]|nr:glycoside hydrolase family 43 protein [Balneolaceae bacterium]
MQIGKKSTLIFSVPILVAGLIFGCSGNSQQQTENQADAEANMFESTFSNPIMENGADPWVYKHSDGYYYYMSTRGDRLTLWRARSLPDIANGEQKTVWTPPESGPNSSNIWAPEIHYLDGDWYIYYTAVDKEEPTDANRRVFVLENESANPLTGEWIDRGPIETEYSGLDGSVFEHNGTRYYLYSAYKDGESVLNISRMKNPWTLEGEESIIASPTYEWEKYEERAICEAPQFLQGKQGNSQLYILQVPAGTTITRWACSWLQIQVT